MPLPKALGSVPSTHQRDSHPPVTPASEDQLLPSGFTYTCAYIHIYMQALNKVHYKKDFIVPFVTFPHCLVVSFFFFLGLLFSTVAVSSILR